MTSFQKAVCSLLSLLFFWVLAAAPGFILPGKNVYGKFPLYCFWERENIRAPEREDTETYEKIIADNAAYLSRQAEAENSSDRPVETPAPTDIPQPEKEQAAETVMAAIEPQPEIDLSPELLADPDYLLEQFYIVDENTAPLEGQLNAAQFLAEDLTLQQDAFEPQILIYHSHSQEDFADSREGEEEDTVVGVGDYLAGILTETYGYQVLHVKEVFDIIDGESDRSRAYDYAREYIEQALEKNPSIEVVIDLHRDGVPEDRHLLTDINGKATAQIMFYNGLSYTLESGALDYLPNPYIQDNLAFSFQLEYQAARYYPGLYRGIYLAGYRYNLHLRPRSILLEAGAQNNTVQEVKNAMEPFAHILHMVLSGDGAV